MAYLEKLKSAMSLNTGHRLTEEEAQRGILVIENLSRTWDSKNFTNEVLPAICLTYYKRDPSLQSTVLTEDFEKGFAFAYRLGLFRNHVRAPDGQIRQFRCPASTTIAILGTKDLGHEVCSHQEQQHPTGRAFGSIYTAIKSYPSPGTPGQAGALKQASLGLVRNGPDV